jgi:hypothetical protein
MPEALSPQQADHAMRNWSHPALGRIRPGSPEHLQMFCGMLLDTHNPYKPAVIDWPRLSPEALQRITTLPNRDMAVQKEGSASVSVETSRRPSPIRCCAKRWTWIAVKSFGFCFSSIGQPGIAATCPRGAGLGIG